MNPLTITLFIIMIATIAIQLWTLSIKDSIIEEADIRLDVSSYEYENALQALENHLYDAEAELSHLRALLDYYDNRLSEQQEDLNHLAIQTRGKAES